MNWNYTYFFIFQNIKAEDINIVKKDKQISKQSKKLNILKKSDFFLRKSTTRTKKHLLIRL